MVTKFFKKLLSSMSALLILSIFISTTASASEIGRLYKDFTPEDFQNHPYGEAIVDFTLRGKLKGYRDGTLRPDDTINRGEFAIMMMRVLNKDDIKEFLDYPPDRNCFPDLKDWHAAEVCSFEEKGFIEGYPDGLFHPERDINFAEASKIIIEVFYHYNNQEILGYVNGQMPNGTVVFSVVEREKKWFDVYVEELSNQSSFPTSIYTFDQKLTRAEVIEILWRLETKPQDVKSSIADTLTNSPGILIGDSRYIIRDGEISHHGFSIDIDEESFEIVGANFITDGDKFYYGDKEIIGEPDLETFESIGWMYAKDANNIYLYSKNQNLYKVWPIADLETFEGMTHDFAKDKNQIYSDGLILDGADRETFDVLPYGYAIDKNNIYAHGKIIPELDAGTFEIINSHFMRDETKLLFGGYDYDLYLPDMDPNSYKTHDVWTRLVTDEDTFYYVGRGSRGINYYGSKIIDPSTFEQVNYKYAKDKNHVYYIDDMEKTDGPKLIEGADANTFYIIHRWHAEDKNNKYTNGVIVDDFGDFDINDIED